MTNNEKRPTKTGKGLRGRMQDVYFEVLPKKDNLYKSIFGTDPESDLGSNPQGEEPEPFDTTTEEQGV